MQLEPLLPKPSKIIYINILYDPRIRVMIFSAFSVISCLALLFMGIAAKTALDIRATRTAYALSTIYRAQTLTAIPTSTHTPTSTVTRTPTPTFTPTITFTPTATPVIAWSNASSPDNNGRTGAMLSLAIGDKDQIYLTYFEDSKDDLRVAKLVSGGWQLDRLAKVVNIGNQRSGWFPSVVLGGGNPHISYYDYDTQTLNYLHLFSPGNWSPTNIIARNVNILDNNIQIDDEGVAYFAFIDNNQGSVIFIKNTNLNPKQEKVDSTGSLSKGIPLLAFALDHNSNSYVAYSTSQGLKYATNASGIWKPDFIDANGLYPDLTVDSSGGIHLVYYNSSMSALIYGYKESVNAQWDYSTIDNDGNVGLYPSLFVDTSGVVHVIYYDATNISLKYAIGRLAGWSKYIVSKVNSEAVVNDIVVDSKGIVHIVYFDKSVERVKYIKGTVRK